jgi:predicted metal-dependent hydrolase
MEELKYTVIFSRRRSMSIIVSPDKTVTVRAPFRASMKTIEKFVQDKSAWIKKHISNDSGIRLSDHGKKYFEGESLLFMGRKYFLRKAISADPYVRITENVIEVGLNDIEDNHKTKALLGIWYLSRAREILSDTFEAILMKHKVYDFSPAVLVVRMLRSRWGSCTSKGKITINSELIKLDQVFHEYVIIHELCHLKYHNHSTDYYRLLAELIPDYKSIRKELRKYITT